MSAPTAAERAAAERIAQGLPPTVADPAVLAKLVAILRGGGAR